MTSSNVVPAKTKVVNNSLIHNKPNGGSSFDNLSITNDASKKLDFLILVIETLQINATDSIFMKAKNIGLSEVYSSRVQFWKIRCTNPLRTSYTYSSLSTEQIDSLVELISSMAENLYPIVRQLLSSKEPETLTNERWFIFSSRLKSLIKERMNLQRSFVNSLLNDSSNSFFRELLVILSLSCGPAGASRLKSSLFYQNRET